MKTAEEILRICEEEKVRYLRLMFTDIMGIIKNVEIPHSQFRKALDGEILFDGSSIEGFTRIEESDMLLKPDLDSFVIFPWTLENGTRVARLICDIYNPDHTPFAGCPRLTLKRACEKAKALGYTMMAGPEVEFFLFHREPNGEPSTKTHDVGGYFDLSPVDKGEDARTEIVENLEKMGFEVEAAHHEVAPGQHEVDFKYDHAVAAADKVVTFRFVVKKIAMKYNLHASFMPKPIFGVNGSGMHTHISLFKDGENAFFDPHTADQLSPVAKGFMAGILQHVASFCAITNPLVNSFKRLVPGYEAPINIAWSERNRSPLVRVPAKRGNSTRCEVRLPDPSCNPYLAFAVMLRAGLEGVENHFDPGPPVNKNIFTMSAREKKRLRIKQLPANLYEALIALERSKLMRDTLGDHIFNHFLYAKKQEWYDYISTVHPWEIQRYLLSY